MNSHPGVGDGDHRYQSSSPSVTSESPPELDSDVEITAADEPHQHVGLPNVVYSESINQSLPHGSSTPDTSASTTSQRKRSKIHGLLGAKFFDSKIPITKKLKWLNRLASVRADGTVQFEIPDEIKPHSLDFGHRVVPNEATTTTDEDEDYDTTSTTTPDFPPLQIVMLIVGTRGDVQPFVAIGKRLQEYGHRVRLATHSNFKEFVKASGLEFYPLGGDPKVLADMVKNKGFLPSEPSEIPIQRSQIKDIVFSLLPACTDDDLDTNIPFNVDAIIANPPAYVTFGDMDYGCQVILMLQRHLKFPSTYFSLCHGRLQVNFHILFQGFDNPLQIEQLSYQIVDALIWMGMRDIINEFRKKKLKLRPVTYLSGSSYTSPHDLPYGYIWSPHLVPKPKGLSTFRHILINWGPHIDVVGFCFLDLASSYVPPGSLVEWLQNGKKPIYIGFGSLPVVDPDGMTETIIKALEITEQRVAKSKDFVYLLDNCPHDWLFLHCAAVVHHGGAGTTAAGLKAACPTTVVPFFGDQPFWGKQVHARGVGPAPIPVEDFSLKKLVAAIQFMLKPEVKVAATELANAMADEDGVKGAVDAFHKHFSRRKGKTSRASPTPPSYSQHQKTPRSKIPTAPSPPQPPPSHNPPPSQLPETTSTFQKTEPPPPSASHLPTLSSNSPPRSPSRSSKHMESHSSHPTVNDHTPPSPPDHTTHPPSSPTAPSLPALASAPASPPPPPAHGQTRC
ncbi:hypothetical protein LXL04_021514 [Taraxacum kok-saghyz]